ncbi:hypothetical protein CF319_g7788 [Tilletia indica]|nr:hypothetical protein CF319_g7788 [Tilletia indica]
MAGKEHRARARRDGGDRGARQQQTPVLASATAAAADPDSTVSFPSTAAAVSSQQPTATPTGTTANSGPTAPVRTTTTTANQNIPTPFSSSPTAAAAIAPSSAATTATVTAGMQDPDISRIALRPEHILGGEYASPSLPQQFEAVEVPLTHRLDRLRQAVRDTY